MNTEHSARLMFVPIPNEEEQAQKMNEKMFKLKNQLVGALTH